MAMATERDVIARILWASVNRSDMDYTKVESWDDGELSFEYEVADRIMTALGSPLGIECRLN